MSGELNDIQKSIHFINLSVIIQLLNDPETETLVLGREKTETQSEFKIPQSHNSIEEQKDDN